MTGLGKFFLTRTRGWWGFGTGMMDFYQICFYDSVNCTMKICFVILYVCVRAYVRACVRACVCGCACVRACV